MPDTDLDTDTGSDVDAGTGPDQPVAGRPSAVLVDHTAASGIVGSQAIIAAEDIPCAQPIHMSGGAAVEDIDGDGAVDILLARHRLPMQLWRNEGDGTFTDVAPELGLDDTFFGGAVAWADIDGDGDLDLFVATTGVQPSRLYLNTSHGFVEEGALRGVAIESAGQDAPDCSRLMAATFGDPDHDGDLDLFVGQWASVRRTSSRYLVNDGNGFFTDRTSEVGLNLVDVHAFTATFADMDGDGWEDLVLTADFGTSRLFLNERGGAFVNVTGSQGVGLAENGMGHVVADLDDDGDLDWFVTSVWQDVEICPAQYGWGCSGNRMYRNDGAGFADVTDLWGLRRGGWGWGAVAADLDLDGHLELMQTNGFWPFDNPSSTAHEPFHEDANRLWWRGDGPQWSEQSELVGLVDRGQGRALIAADLDGDGDPDILQTQAAGPPRLWRTERAPGHHWLAVRAPGGQSNRVGIGAVVEVETSADLRGQRRVIGANNGYMGHGPFEARFGLGRQQAPVDVRVFWPASGRSTTMYDVALDQVIVVAEPVQ